MRRKRAASHPDGGFSLIELLVAVAIIGLIVAIAVPALQSALDRSKQRATMTDMRQIGSALLQYYLDNSYYPNGSLSMTQLLPLLETYGGGPYPTQDRWGHDFVYSTDIKNYFSLECYGRDGLDGTNITYGTRNDFNLDIVFATGQFRHSPVQ